jgi:hypothetical protein
MNQQVHNHWTCKQKRKEKSLPKNRYTFVFFSKEANKKFKKKKHSFVPKQTKIFKNAYFPSFLSARVLHCIKEGKKKFS